MLTTPPNSAHPMVQSQCLNWPQLLNIIVGRNFSLWWSDPNINCLPLRQTTQLSAYMAQSQLPTSQHHGRTPTSSHHGRNSTSTVCLNGRQPNYLPTSSTVNSQLTLFQNLQILRIIASGHDIIHTPASFPILGLLWPLWLSYPLRTSVKLYPMSVHLN